MKNLALLFFMIISVFTYGQVEPIPCPTNSVFYQVKEGNEFVRYDPATLSYNLIFTNSYAINAIGYNVQDNFIYGIRQKSNRLVRVGLNGVFDDLGIVQNLPAPGSKSYYTGDFDLSGNLYVTYGTINTVYNIDVVNMTATAINMTGGDLSNVADFTFLPGPNRFYGLNGDSGHLMEFNPINGSVNDLGATTPATTCGSNYGASFADNNGFLYFFCNNDGDLFKVHQATKSSTLLQATGLSLNSNDGAACPESDGLITTDSSAYCCGGENLIFNGNFESGDVGFVSEYNSVHHNQVLPGDYSVINYIDAGAICSNWEVEDHTHCVNGVNDQILVVNGQTQQSSNTNNIIWQTPPIQVELDSQYKFCAFVKHLPQCCFDITPEIRIEIKYEETAWFSLQDWTSISYTGPAAAPCGWVQVGGSFTAIGPTIEIRILMDELGNGDGNDLALDDISLTKLDNPELTITVEFEAFSDPLILEASIFSIDNIDDLLPDDSCEYVWSIVEVISISPLQLDWAQTINNNWMGGTGVNNSNNWGLTTSFPGISLPGDKLYMVHFAIANCECSANTSVPGYVGGGLGLINDVDRMDMKSLKTKIIETEESKALARDYLNRIFDKSKTQSKPNKNALNQGLNSSLRENHFDKKSIDSDVTIYPNPFNNEFTVSFDKTIGKIELYSTTGKNCTSKIKQEKSGNKIIVDSSQLPSGIYFIEIESQGKTIKKVIKINPN